MKPENLKALIVDKYFGADNKDNRLKTIEEFNNDVWFDMFDDFLNSLKINLRLSMTGGIIQ